MTGPAAGPATLSVVIPAHDEERVIRRTLDTLLAGAGPGEFEVIVACNGCTDRTVEIAGGYAPRVRTVVVPQASKAAALAAGDRAASAFPRVFLDADVEVDAGTLRAVREALSPPPGPGVPLAAAPHIEIADGECSWGVRAYYAVWGRLPWAAAGLLGTGFYAISETGRARFGDFPDLVSDDLFVRSLFAPAERLTVAGSFRVRPPRKLAALVRSKTRVYAGNRQYAAAVSAGSLPRATGAAAPSAGIGTRAAVLQLAREPRWWPPLGVYVGVVAVAKGRARLRVRRGQTTRWDQDVSGRSS